MNTESYKMNRTLRNCNEGHTIAVVDDVYRFLVTGEDPSVP